MFVIAAMILGIGLYRQYASAAGVFAADGLALRAQQTLDGLLGFGSLDEAEALGQEAEARGATSIDLATASEQPLPAAVPPLPVSRFPSRHPLGHSLGHCPAHSYR
jgi:hypothetical protein